MNYLAHALLAGPDPEWVLGSYLGDHVRGDLWRNYPPGIGLGILLHRKVDVFTDAHPAFARSRRLLDPPFRRYAGILLDLFFDHFLARDFERLAGRDAGVFACVCYTTLRLHRHLLPDSLLAFARYQEQHNLLITYADTEVLDRAIRGVASRMRRPGPLAEGMSQLRSRAERLQADFEVLFADLQRFAADQRAELAAVSAASQRRGDRR